MDTQTLLRCTQHPVVRLGVGVLVAAACMGFRAGLELPLAEAAVLFLGSILATTYFAGMAAGIIVAAVAGVCVNYLVRAEPLSVSDSLLKTFPWIFWLTSAATWGIGAFFRHRLVRERRIGRQVEAREARHRAMVENIKDHAIFMLDLDGHVATWNEGAERLLGYSATEILGQSYSRFFTKEDVDLGMPASELAQARRDGQLSCEGWHIRKDGTRFFATNAVSPLNSNGFSIVMRDVTERRRLQEERRLSEDRLKGIINSAMDAIISIDGATMSITLFNRAAEAMFRIRAAETIGHPFERFLPFRIHHLFRDHLQKFDEDGATSRSVGAPQGTLMAVRADGREFPMEATVSKTVVGGQKLFTLIIRDISERQRAEERLRTSEERLKGVINSAMDAIITLNADDHRIILFNPAAEAMFRIRAAEAAGSPLDRFLPERSRDAHRAYIDRFAAATTAQALGVQRTMTALRADGEEFPMEATLSQSEVSGQKFYTVIIRDVSERKQAEERFRRSEERFRVAQELSLDGFYVLRSLRDGAGHITDFRFEYANPTAARVMRTTPDRLFGQSLLTLFPAFKTKTRLFAEYVAVVASGTAIDLEVFYEGENSQAQRWYRVMAVKLDDGVAVSFADISQRKKVEMELREDERRAALLAEVSSLLASSLEYETTLQSVARMAVPNISDWCIVDMFTEENTREFLAVAHTDEQKAGALRDIYGRAPLRDGVHFGPGHVLKTGRPELIAKVTDDLLGAFAQDDAQREYVRALGLKSAMIVPLIARGRTLGVITLAIAESDRRYDLHDLPFATELARRAALAVDNARLYREAQNVNRMKDEFLATLSHELRTPLTAILGWVRMLQGGKLSVANSARGLEVIERNTKAQSKLVEDLLDVSRIITGKLQLNVRPVELMPVIETALDAIRPAAEAKKIRLLSMLTQLDRPVWGDGDRLQQIVWNLLSNAVKFTPTNGQVEVRVERAGDEVRICVSDTGKGFKEEFKPFIFQRFRQADSTTTRAFGGLGLGLAIVRHLVEVHGGTVRADSAGEGQGATFTVTLPLMQPSEFRQPEEARPAILPDAVRPQAFEALEGVHVLVVEDEVDAREMISMVLQQCGAKVTATSNAKEAMRIFEEIKPDVLISDIGMPDEDGYTLINKLRRLEATGGAHIPAAALTAFAKREDRTRALAAGFETHVSKPVEPSQLAHVVAELTGRQRRVEPAKAGDSGLNAAT